MTNAQIYAEVFHKIKWFGILLLAGLAICGLWVLLTDKKGGGKHD